MKLTHLQERDTKTNHYLTLLDLCAQGEGLSPQTCSFNQHTGQDLYFYLMSTISMYLVKLNSIN